MYTIPLEEVILTVSENDYDRLCEIVQQQDWIDVFKNYNVIEKNLIITIHLISVCVAGTLPVERGIMNLNTKVLLLKDSSTTLFSFQDSPQTSFESSLELSGISKSDVIQSLSWNTMDLNTTNGMNERLNQEQWISFQVYTNQKNTNIKENACAFSSFQFIRLGLINHESLVQIKDSNGRTRVAWATSTNEFQNQKQESVLISPLFAFNLGQFNPLNPLNQIDICISNPFTKPIGYTDLNLAHTIELQLVLSESALDKDLNEQSLLEIQKWFQQENRIVTCGDIIVIEMNGNLHNKLFI